MPKSSTRAILQSGRGLPKESMDAATTTGWQSRVEQTQGQRQTGRNDLPGKGERVA